MISFRYCLLRDIYKHRSSLKENGSFVKNKQTWLLVKEKEARKVYEAQRKTFCYYILLDANILIHIYDLIRINLNISFPVIDIAHKSSKLENTLA